MIASIRLVAASLLTASVMLASPVRAESVQAAKKIEEATADFDQLSVQALIGTPEEREAALEFFVERGKLDIMPTLVLLSNLGGSPKPIMEAISKLTGEKISDWREAMLWQDGQILFAVQVIQGKKPFCPLPLLG